MGEKQQPKSCIYPKPEHYNDLADKPITKCFIYRKPEDFIDL